MEALTVACVQVGNYLGMGDRYVEVLRSMCARHVPPHEFVCITESDLTGYWSKLELFKPGRFTGNVLYFDLDVSIRGDLGPLLECFDYGDFWALDDFAWPLSRAPLLEKMERAGKIRPGMEAIKPLLGGWGTCNSSVMLWRAPAGREIWEQYSPEAVGTLDGDQNFITKIMGNRLKLIPPGFAGSYRYGPDNCPITVYHGSPKPHEVYDPHWI